jgi:hypothetical protein
MFKIIKLNGANFVKIDGRWCKEGGDGEMYPVMGQKEINEIYEKTKGGK